MKEAAQFAETTQILMNVSEFTDVSQATDTLISAVQAFGYTAETSMDVVDLLNTIGNNYAISTADLAQSLTKSSASLVAAGGDLAEAAALTATANKIIQDADSVGTALKTTSLRLRGTDVKVLEEEGLDSEGAVSSKSKLQSKVKALSGVDILTATGEYKSTYEILSEIADVWADINDMDQAALLELISGKRNSSVIAAILQNPEELKAAFEDASNASGSALKENEKYLDSIQGKIDQFNNAIQTLGSNTLDSDVVKFLVDLATKLVKIVDTIGPLNIALVGIVAFLEKKHGVFSDFFNPVGNRSERLTQQINESFDAERAKNSIRGKRGARTKRINQLQADGKTFDEIQSDPKIKQYTKDIEEAEQALNQYNATTQANTASNQANAESHRASAEATNANTAAEVNDTAATTTHTSATWADVWAEITSADATSASVVATLKKVIADKLAGNSLVQKGLAAMVASGAITAETAAEAANLPITTLLTAGFYGLASGIKAAVVAMWELMTTTPLGPILLAVTALVAGIVILVNVIDDVWVTAGEAKEKLAELNSEINDLESDLDSLNDELKTTQDRMEDLLSKSSLSFVEQEELENLKLQNEYLEKQIELQEMILENKKSERASTAKDVVAKTWNSKSYGKADYQVDWDDGVIKHDNFWSFGLSGKDAIEKGLKKYIATKNVADQAYKDYQSALKEYGSESSFTKANKKTYEDYQDLLTKQAGGINMVLGEMSDIILNNELQYGDDADINKFLDEYYAMTLKWREAQGVASKSDIIKHIFNDSTSEDIQNLKKQLDDVANSDLDNATKQTKAQELIQDALKDTSGNYDRLRTTIDTLDMSVASLAESFIAVSSAPDINTIGGILQVFANGEEILKSEANNLQVGIDEAGESIVWDNLFEGPEGERKADNLKVAAILEGADKAVRDQFIKLIEEVENGKMGVDEALAKWKMVGVDKAISALNTEFESLNNEMFPDAADEISGLIDTLGELKSAFESVANTMDTFKGAQEEYNKTGRVSIQTALELMSSTDEWDKILNITEDSITLVDGAEKALMESQLESIAEQMQTAADMAKIKLDAAIQAQKAKEAFDEEANAANNLSTAEQNVNTTQQNANITTQQRTGAMGDLAVQTYGTAISELDYAANDTTVQTAESVKAKAIGLVSAAIVGLDSFIDALLTDKTMKEAWSEYQEARNVVLDDANSKTTSVDQLRKDYEQKQIMANVAKNGDTYNEFQTNWDGNDDEKKAEEDAFQKEMDYWENRIKANQARADRLQGQIDLLEQKGLKASAQYYRDQMTLLNSVDPDDGVDSKLELLQGKLGAVTKRLKDVKEGSEEWWEAAHEYNDIVNEIQEIESAIVDMQDAIGEIDTYKFEEFNTRLGNLTSKLETIRNLIAPDGEEDWFDEEGNWTESGVAVLGSHLQELEMYKQGYAETVDELNKYVASYKGNEAYYKTLGIHSEQEWYDKTEELISQQYDFAESISDTEQAVVDMYESSIDAVEEYVDTLIDGYNDYIDSVKEALDAERDLYDFKKNVQKQAKDIAEIERRIASLSGSTNKSDIAERRKLEAQLYESRESLNDTYYDHAKQSQQDALDSEREAYEDNMNRFVEGLRTSLDAATLNMDEFLMGVTSMVMYNADIVLTKYEETNLPLTKELTNPWEEAKKAVGSYSGNALDLMNQWTKEGGFFAQFNVNGTRNLESPWKAGTTAANSFKTSVSDVMTGVVSNIATNVKTASSELSKLYQQIKSTEEKAASANVTPGGNTGNTGGNTSLPPLTKTYSATAYLQIGNDLYSASGSGTSLSAAQNDAKGNVVQRAYNAYKANGYDDSWIDKRYNTWRNNVVFSKPTLSRASQLLNTRGNTMYAKGTAGTTRDEWAITDEPRFGDELVLVPGKDGNLSFMRKGTGVVPADLTANLMEWGKFSPDAMNLAGGVNVNMINNAINKPEFNFAFDALVKAENITEETLPAVKKLVTQELNRFTKELNYALKGKGAR